ncbi:tRNA pseudouridine(55) synthase TruB [Spirochaeta dissipatitropha]
MQGLLVLHKPVGISSFKALSPVKKALDRKTKVGHTGTLDPFAEGLMLVLIGSFTRLNSQVLASNKTYVAEICLGKETDTLDNTGNIIKSMTVPELTPEKIAQTLSVFTGIQNQIPPLYSAIHVNGERAYNKARNGELFDLPPRKIEIQEIKLLDFYENSLRIEVTCGSGTYIRSLARDIADKLGTCGHLTSLLRSRVGEFNLDDALLIDPDTSAVENSSYADTIRKKIQQDEHAYSMLTGNPVIRLKPDYIDAFADGKPAKHSWFYEKLKPATSNYGVFTDAHVFCGQIVSNDIGSLSYRFVSPHIQERK